MRETEPVTSAPDKVAKSLDTDGTKSVKLPVQQRCWDRWQERLEQCLASIANRYPNAFARAPRLKTWMQALVYPALHGAFMYAFLQQIGDNYRISLEPTHLWPAAWPWGYKEWLGLLMLIYFGTLYVETETTEAESYNSITFVLDVVEVAAMLLAFAFLGYFGAWQANPAAFYCAIIPAFLCPIIWRKVIEERVLDFYDVLCVGAITFAVIGAVIGVMYSRHDIWVVRCLWCLLAVYVVDLIVSYGCLMPLRRISGDICWISGEYQSVRLRGRHRPKPISRSFNVGDKFESAPRVGSKPDAPEPVSCEWRLSRLSWQIWPLSAKAACEWKKRRLGSAPRKKRG